jgi:hypothetical protein
LKAGFEEAEAGVAELMEYYDAVEGIYAEASASMYTHEVVYASDTTEIGAYYAHMGPTSASSKR